MSSVFLRTPCISVSNRQVLGKLKAWLRTMWFCTVKFHRGRHYKVSRCLTDLLTGTAATTTTHIEKVKITKAVKQKKNNGKPFDVPPFSVQLALVSLVSIKSVCLAIHLFSCSTLLTVT